jgi:hypothetical protein
MRLRISTRALHADKSARKYYWCDKCKQSVSAHPDGKPHSIQADDRTRNERRKAHADIDCYMLITGMSKSRVYKRMAYLMRMKHDDLHLGYFDYELCCRFRTVLAQDLLRLTMHPDAVGD